MVESTALEMRRTGNRIVGSNPTLSARRFTANNRTVSGGSGSIGKASKISSETVRRSPKVEQNGRRNRRERPERIFVVINSRRFWPRKGPVKRRLERAAAQPF